MCYLASEESLRMVTPGEGFRGVTLYRQKYSWRPKKKKKKRSSLQNELVSVRKYVMTKKRKEKVFAYQSVGFWSQKKKTTTNVVTPKWWHPRRAAPLLSDATVWPKGYQRWSLGKSHQNGEYLKTSNAKKLSSRRLLGQIACKQLNIKNSGQQTSKHHY